MVKTITKIFTKQPLIVYTGITKGKLCRTKILLLVKKFKDTVRRYVSRSYMVKWMSGRHILSYINVSGNRKD